MASRSRLWALGMVAVLIAGSMVAVSRFRGGSDGDNGGLSRRAVIPNDGSSRRPEIDVTPVAPDGEVRELLLRLQEVCGRGDNTEAKKLTTLLIALGEKVVPQIRDLLIDNNVSLAEHTEYELKIWEILCALRSERSSFVLLDGFALANNALLSASGLGAPQAMRILILFANSIAERPTAKIVARVRVLYAECRNVTVRQVLIRLMTVLLKFDGTLRHLLVKIVLEAPESELRLAAGKALGESPSAESVPVLIELVGNILHKGRSYGPEEIYTLTKALLKTMPLEEVMSLLVDSIETSVKRDNVTAFGHAIGDAYAKGDLTDLDPLFVRLHSTSNPHMQNLCLEALYRGARKESDPRVSNLAMKVFSESSDAGVQAMAIQAGIAHADNQNSVLEMYRAGYVNKSIVVSANAVVGLMQYVGNHPEATDAIGEVIRVATTGENRSIRLSCINSMSFVTAPVSFEECLRTLGERDADQEIRTSAKRAYDALMVRYGDK